ncbi:zf-HC2 domain-containing protein [Candidatus Bipolaricaulota bacterium]|nr:zf-HC2 domain-containing protein [Candidatus Bipolaricaulota bacterium]
MMTCNEARELIPWYVAGSLSAHEVGELAVHVADCSDCRAQLARDVSLGIDLEGALKSLPGIPSGGFEKVSRQIKRLPSTGVDIGSFLAGLSVGLSARGSGAPLKADLKLLGYRIPLLGNEDKLGGQHDR